MSGLQTRGYLITTTAAYLRNRVGDDEFKNITKTFSPEVQRLITDAKPAVWYPIAQLTELNLAIAASLGRGDTAQTREALYQCGKFAAREATNSFLRMFLRILTPNMFAKKLPEVFRRDFSGGKIVVNVGDHSISCEMSEVPGFIHAGPLGPGFASFPLEAMGKTIESYSVGKWSLEDPNPAQTSFELSWKD